jgi:hypothetical protein
MSSSVSFMTLGAISGLHGPARCRAENRRVAAPGSWATVRQGRESVPLHSVRVLLKSAICCTMYCAGRPAMPAFSGPPGPSARWHTPHAITSGLRPWATMSGSGGWSEGCQSSAKNRFRASVTVNAAVLSGTCRGVPSSGCTLKSGGFTAYAQAGGTSSARAGATSVAVDRATPSANPAGIAFTMCLPLLTPPLSVGWSLLRDLDYNPVNLSPRKQSSNSPVR